MSDSVWYFGYGSNTCRKRFRAYIDGTTFNWGGTQYGPLSDNTLPKENRQYKISHELYFSNQSTSWQDGGIAFISPNSENKHTTYGRIWKITEWQFEKIWEREGKTLYSEKIILGNLDGIPIVTITKKDKSGESQPSRNYVMTIIAGLKETYGWTDKEISDYLLDKRGIRDNYSKDEIASICADKEIAKMCSLKK